MVSLKQLFAPVAALALAFSSAATAKAELITLEGSGKFTQGNSAWLGNSFTFRGQFDTEMSLLNDPLDTVKYYGAFNPQQSVDLGSFSISPIIETDPDFDANEDYNPYFTISSGQAAIGYVKDRVNVTSGTLPAFFDNVTFIVRPADGVFDDLSFDGFLAELTGANIALTMGFNHFAPMASGQFENFQVNSVPEPVSSVLTAIGMGAIYLRSRKRKPESADNNKNPNAPSGP